MSCEICLEPVKLYTLGVYDCSYPKCGNQISICSSCKPYIKTKYCQFHHHRFNHRQCEYANSDGICDTDYDFDEESMEKECCKCKRWHWICMAHHKKSKLKRFGIKPDPINKWIYCMKCFRELYLKNI